MVKRPKNRGKAVCTRICIALPIQVNGLGKMSRMAEEIAEHVRGLGYKTIESHLVYIHSSLTREIMVYESARVRSIVR